MPSLSASASANDAVAALTLDLRDALQAHNFSAGTGTNGNQLLVSRMISGGTTTDRSPLSSLVTVAPVIDASQGSTVATFVKGDTVSNVAAQTSGNFTFDVSETALNGIRITMTNVGTFGNLMGTPIINQPQVAIMACGVIKKKPVVLDDGSLGATTEMELSLSVDHRVIDGVLGAQLLNTIVDNLENPIGLLNI